MPTAAATAEIPRLLEQLIDIAQKIDGGRRSPFLREIEDRTDQISTLVASLPHDPPADLSEMADRWKGYGLTCSEAQMADLMHSRLGRCVSLQALLDCTTYRKGDDQPELKTVQVRICKIRQKLAAGNSPYAVDTMWGVGYEMRLRDTPPSIASRTRAA